LPEVRQEFGQAVGVVGGQTREYVVEVGEKVDADMQARSHVLPAAQVAEPGSSKLELAVRTALTPSALVPKRFPFRPAAGHQANSSFPA
jgi:hypothetical protein